MLFSIAIGQSRTGMSNLFPVYPLLYHKNYM